MILEVSNEDYAIIEELMCTLSIEEIAYKWEITTLEMEHIIKKRCGSVYGAVGAYRVRTVKDNIDMSNKGLSEKLNCPISQIAEIRANVFIGDINILKKPTISDDFENIVQLIKTIKTHVIAAKYGVTASAVAKMIFYRTGKTVTQIRKAHRLAFLKLNNNMPVNEICAYLCCSRDVVSALRGEL